MAFLHGKGGSLLVGGVEYRVKSWDATFEADAADVTSTGIPTGGTVGGYGEVIAGIKRCKGSFTAYWDDQNPPDVTVGSYVDSMNLNVHTGGGKTLGKALITSVQIKMDVGAPIEWTCSFENNGEYSSATS